MTKWNVLLEFSTKHPAFEMVVEAETKLDAEITVERAAVDNGWADAELRSITTWPLVQRAEAV